MAQVTLAIGGNNYDVACRDGEEPHLHAIASIVDKKTGEARAAVGSANEVRQLLFASLLLADELQELRTNTGNAGDTGHTNASSEDPAALEEIAQRLENLATRLENRGGNA
jgi:cell division protein ZapA